MGNAAARRLLFAGTLLAVISIALVVALRAGGDRAAVAQARPVAAIAPSESAISRMLGADERQFWARPTSAGALQFNRGQRLTASYGAGGVELRVPGGTVSMRLTSVAPIAPSVRENRVTYARANGLSEWYANGPLGLEQGLRLLDGAGPTQTFQYALGGSLSPQLRGGALDFMRGDQPVLSYRGLSASDATGRTLPSHLSLGGDRLTITVDALGARYPINVDPTIQNASLTGSDSVAGDGFGFSVAQNSGGNVVVVGAPSAKVNGAYTGAAYVFAEPKTGWANAKQNLKLTAPDGAAGDRFGLAVGVVGSTIVVGAPGHTVGANAGAGAVYAWAPGATTPAELITSPGVAGAALGGAIAVAGPQLFVGATGYNAGAGAVFEYNQPTTGWTTTTPQTAILTASDPTINFGTALAASGVTVVAGSPFSTVGTNVYAGAAYIFTEPSTGWHNITQTAKLTASDAAQSDMFGTSVATYADTGTIAVGAPGASGGKGATYVFQQGASGWQSGTQKAEMTQSSATTSTRIGHTVAITDPAGTGPPLPPGAKAAQTGPPTPSGWQIAVVGGSSNGTGLVTWSAANGTWANQTSGTPVILPVLGTSASAYSVDVGTGLVAIGNQTTIGSVVVIPTATSTTGPCTGTSCCTTGSTVCCAARDGSIAPIDVRPDLNNINCDNRGFYYFASTTINAAQTIVGGILVPVGGLITYAGYAGEFATAGGSTLAVVGGILIAGGGANMVRTAAISQNDPPDPHFQSLLAVPRVKALKLHAEKGLSARAAKAVGKYGADVHKAAAVATTLATTINRAGGAIVANSTTWEGRQIRYAIGLTKSFAADVAIVVKDAKSVVKAAKGSPALTAPLSAAKLRAVQRKYGKRAVPARLAKLAATYGLTASQLKAALKAKLPRKLPKTLLQFLTGPTTLSGFKDVAKAYTAWSKVPQIVLESQLT